MTAKNTTTNTASGSDSDDDDDGGEGPRVDYMEVSVPGDKAPAEMGWRERRAYLLELVLSESGPTTVDDVSPSRWAEECDVSAATICKDKKRLRTYLAENVDREDFVADLSVVRNRVVRGLLDAGEEDWRALEKAGKEARAWADVLGLDADLDGGGDSVGGRGAREHGGSGDREHSGLGSGEWDAEELDAALERVGEISRWRSRKTIVEDQSDVEIPDEPPEWAQRGEAPADVIEDDVARGQLALWLSDDDVNEGDRATLLDPPAASDDDVELDAEAGEAEVEDGSESESEGA
ncbi:hypothetical protein [Halorussus marinus]|uniref:hypothetical protein n=1 Tax=Halorussus marinus TaxID=2505976 RepID=UPI001092A970|nr:hypothetical protein [Halorussus marinus]